MTRLFCRIDFCQAKDLSNNKPFIEIFIFNDSFLK